MDTRDQLQSLARAIDLASDVERAWAGIGPAVDMRKHCGICREEQPVRVPFLRHVCRSCTSIWVPAICGDCATTSVAFTTDGQLSRLASCGCGGQLRVVAYVPSPRVEVAPEVAAARKVVIETRKKRATLTSRTVLVVIAVLAAVGAVRLVHHNHSAPPAAENEVRRPLVADDPSMTMAARGRLAAARLEQQGRVNDVFACAGELPTAPTPAPSPSPGVVTAPQPAPDVSGFLASCLKG